MGNSLDNTRSNITLDDQNNFIVKSNNSIIENGLRTDVTLFENKSNDKNDLKDSNFRSINKLLMFVKEINKDKNNLDEIRSKISCNSFYTNIFKKIKDNYEEQNNKNNNNKNKFFRREKTNTNKQGQGNLRNKKIKIYSKLK